MAFKIYGLEEEQTYSPPSVTGIKMYGMPQEQEEEKPVAGIKMYGGYEEKLDTPTDLDALPTANTIDDLMSDKNYAVVQEYMSRRFGMDEKTHDRQKVVDSFVNHMRKFNFGQSVVTATELAWLNSKDNDVDRMSAGNAYQLFDNMKGAFSEEYDFLDKADAVYDYGRALIVDPLNVVSLGVGKLLTGGATKAAAVAAKEGVRRAIVKELGQEALTKTASEAVKAKAKQIERRVIGNVLRGEAVEGVAAGAFNKAAKKKATQEILTTAAFDTVANISIDAIYQKALQQAYVQDDYNVLQGAVAGAGGLVGGSLAYGLNLMSKAPHSEASLPLAMRYFDEAAQAEAQAKKLLRTQRKKSNAKAIADMDVDELVKTLQEETSKADRWADKVLRGDTLRRTAEEATDPRRDAFLGAFLHGDRNGEFKGIKQILEDFDIELSNEVDNFKNFTDFLTETIKDLPPTAKAEVESLYKTTMQRLPEFNNKNLDEGLDVLSSLSSEWGRTGATLSKLSQDLKLAPSKTPAQKMNEIAEENLDPASKTFRDQLNDTQGALQRNLIRMLVTHPGTTALNIVGWTNATAMQSASDMIRGALYGGASVGNFLVGKTGNAVEYGNKAKLMLTLQRQKMTNLVSPFATQQATMDFLAANPKTQKELFRYLSGGIEIDDVYRELGIGAADFEKTGVFERVMDFAQTMYGVKAQDVYTKSQEFMYALDKQVRLKYGVTYAEFLQDKNKLWKRMQGEDYAQIQAAAVEDALRNVYAKSYGKNPKGALSFAARILEDMRKYPVIGAMVPFGQFFNNTLGHMFDHTGISLVHKYVAGTTRDPMELLTKSAVGLSMIGITASREYKNMEEGLAWYQERQSDGEIRNRLYDFPFSFYKAIGRMAAHVKRDGSVPEELTRDILQVFGPGQLTRQLGDSAKMSYDLLVDIASGEDVVVKEGLIKVVQDAASMYISGYSRPFDPVNQIVALGRGENYTTVDRKQGAEWVNKSARYVDQIYTALSGEEIAPEKYSPLTDVEGAAPIGRIFGYRADPAQSSIQRMFNEVGMPQWRTEIKSYIPEVQNDINKYIFYHLEDEAAFTLATPAWKNASSDKKKDLLKAVVSRAKKRTEEILELSISPKDERTHTLWKLSKRGGAVSEQEAREALRDLNIDKDITDLNEKELSFLINYLEILKADDKKLKFQGMK